MKLSPLIAGVVLVVMLPLWSWARLGETPEQCEERYGAPIPNTDRFKNVIPRETLPSLHMPLAIVARYHASGLKILIVFTNGTAGQIFYQKLMDNPWTTQGDLSEAEIQTLLKANSGDKTWDDGEVNGKEMWVLSDQSAYAVYNSNRAYDAIQDSSAESKFLLVTTAEFHNTQEANKKASEAKNLEGL
jgi:hypothetical protein